MNWKQGINWIWDFFSFEEERAEIDARAYINFLAHGARPTNVLTAFGQRCRMAPTNEACPPGSAGGDAATAWWARGSWVLANFGGRVAGRCRVYGRVIGWTRDGKRRLGWWLERAAVDGACVWGAREKDCDGMGVGSLCVVCIRRYWYSYV